MAYLIAILLAPWLPASGVDHPQDVRTGMGAVSPSQAASTRSIALVAPRRLRIIHGNIRQSRAGCVVLSAVVHCNQWPAFFPEQFPVLRVLFLMERTDLNVHVKGDQIFVGQDGSDFFAIYHKARYEPELVATGKVYGSREFLTKAWLAASAKARELGWID